MKYLILQADSAYVYAVINSPISANAVTKSIPGTFTMAVTTRTFGGKVFKAISQKDYFKLNTYKLSPSYKKLLLVPDDEIPQNWKDTQNTIDIRLALMTILNTWYQQVTVASDCHHWNSFLQHIASDLKKSDLVTNKFTRRIKHYAASLELSEADAYVKLRDEVVEHYKYQFNLSVIMEKHKARIATVTTENQAIQVKQNLQRDLVSFCKEKGSIDPTINANKLLSKDVNDFVFS